MSRITALITLILLITAKLAFSDTFIVTNKADSGPGTLRQALSDAASNGIASTDRIEFNLPGSTINDRTIRLRSQLPMVSSKVIIDGSTQPSAVFGVSGAKVIIEREFNNVYYSGLVISTNVYNETISDVEIYGLYIRNFANITSLSNINTSQGSGIIVEYNAKNVTIGAPGKGNVICGNINGISINGSSYYDGTNYVNSSGKIIIQSNLIGLLDNGTTANTNYVGISVNLAERELNIGGDNTGEENVISANATDILIDRSSYYNSKRAVVNIISNKIGTDWNGTKDFKGLPLFSQSASVDMYGIRASSSLTDLNIMKNIISGHLTCGISISYADFLITANHIGTDVNGTTDLGNTVGIRIESGAQGRIGRSADEDKNYIGYNRYGIDVLSEKPTTISRNSIFCNTQFGIGKATRTQQTYVQVLKIKSDHISGKATPNAEVELFYSDNCPGSCQGKTYFFTTAADNSGRWEYNGNLTGHVVATATLPSYVTSMFSTAGLQENEAKVEPVTCKGLGSITVSEPREGIGFKWYRLEENGTSVFIGNTQSVSGLDVATYEVKIDDGCKTVLHTFYITDQKLTKPVITPPVPACGQTSFQFYATTLRGKGNISYRWINSGGQTVGYGQYVSLPQGTYSVEVTDEAGCLLKSDPVTIVRKPQPVINTSGMVSTAAACGKPNGSIKGITTSDITGNVRYQWYVYDMYKGKTGDAVTGQTNVDLTNVEGGYYQLQVSDQGGCPPVYSSPLYINIYNSVIVNIGSIQGTTCGKKNGSVTGITIQEGNHYKLYNALNVLVKEEDYLGIPINLSGLSAGNYVIIGESTISGCTSNPTPFTVYEITPENYTFSTSIQPTTCGLTNGSITFTYNVTSARPARYQWTDAGGQVLSTGTQTQIKDLGPGDYTYTAYDANDCPRTYVYTIARTEILKIDASAVKPPVNDYCGLKRGSITGLKATGGIPGYIYSWIDENNKEVGTSLDLLNIGEGKYRLVLKDQTSCGVDTSDEYTVVDQSRPMADPLAADVRVCYTTEITIPVSNVEEGTYQLYKKLSDPSPFMENTTGIFTFLASGSSDYYVRRVLGHCISNFTKIHVEVTNDNLEITNTMTPNGDGVNDIWSLTGLPDYPDIRIQLYSRDGQLVYECIGPYTKPFDGHFRGAELPAGVYYYKIDLRGDCKPLSGSLTLLR
ncbi:gliding motility-associated C-terminal domain-containing protein [Arcticibacter tournemirensis]|uniref:Gliding motility-associated C-terminal domain-containing protein n=1 Tax=Arcticibacter tournemirensis TaxID=699437 RepID=A0A4Q0M370_9SPHI|nr:gliding motility-associated C-terminal domain-containing protein [Arcticibacter tournemirensis]RXF67360.1 gliding motility-associated C-terminal domain-containing protein [Arcticibacter tournemirensis]